MDWVRVRINTKDRLDSRSLENSIKERLGPEFEEYVSLTTGTATHQSSGNINLVTGSATSSAGSVNIAAGASARALGSDVSISASASSYGDGGVFRAQSGGGAEG